MIKFILTVPNHLKVAVLQQMLAWRTEAEPDEVAIRIIDRPVPQVRAHTHAPEPVGEAALPAQLVATVPAPAAPPDRSTKVYRVIDTAAPIGPVLQTIRIYLLDHPNSTCRQVITATGRGQKSIESGIHMLRVKGIIKESERQA